MIVKLLIFPNTVTVHNVFTWQNSSFILRIENRLSFLNLQEWFTTTPDAAIAISIPTVASTSASALVATAVFEATYTSPADVLDVGYSSTTQWFTSSSKASILQTASTFGH